jgi:hypothetical protein
MTNTARTAMPTLDGGVGMTVFGNVPAECFGAPVLDDIKQPNLPVLDGRDLGRVCGPHQVPRVGDDLPICGVPPIVTASALCGSRNCLPIGPLKL